MDKKPKGTVIDSAFARKTTQTMNDQSVLSFIFGIS